jgi:hypothetical protein
MKDDETIKKLDELAKINKVCESFQQELGGLIEQAFLNCPDLKERYDEIQQELEVLTPRRFANIKLITAYVLGKQESVKGELLQAVFSKGRTSWDTKKLEGYAIAHPELKELKKTGKPSVSIREVKEKMSK